MENLELRAKNAAPIQMWNSRFAINNMHSAKNKCREIKASTLNKSMWYSTIQSDIPIGRRCKSHLSLCTTTKRWLSSLSCHFGVALNTLMKQIEFTRNYNSVLLFFLYRFVIFSRIPWIDNIKPIYYTVIKSTGTSIFMCYIIACRCIWFSLVIAIDSTHIIIYIVIVYVFAEWTAIKLIWCSNENRARCKIDPFSSVRIAATTHILSLCIMITRLSIFIEQSGCCLFYMIRCCLQNRERESEKKKMFL